MDDQRQHVIDTIKQANNVLVTVRNSPSIDQLSSCIALTLILNELGKHGTAVFSGEVPSVLGFLEPEKTLERNTDSLRDFIISLDKAKADKLRYKVEDKVVKIFITPYKTSLSSNDLEFGQGDFNVDVVVALGVHEQSDLDEAITAHGRILHDATVISFNTSGEADRDLGNVNWTDGTVSSLSEMVADIAEELGTVKSQSKEGQENGGEGDRTNDKPAGSVIDNQVATALLTGIVAETERFGNAKTKPETMEVAAKLLAAGANQELVANELSKPVVSQSEPGRDGRNGGGDGASSENGNDFGVLGSGPTDSSNTPSNTDVSYKIDDTGALSIDHQYDEPKPADSPSFSGPVEPIGPSELPSPSLPPVYDFGRPQQPQFGSGAMMPTDGPNDMDMPRSLASDTPSVSGGQKLPDQPSGDELEALDFLKEHQIDNANTRVLQPLHGKEELLADEPKIGPAKPAPTDGAPQDADLEDNKYALTPPSLGGTLTANMPSEDEAVGASDADSVPAAPLLHHERPAGSMLQEPKIEAAPLTEAADAGGDAPAESEAPASTTVTRGDAPAQLQSAGAHAIEAAPLDPAEDSTSPAEAIHGTLADLETQVRESESAAQTTSGRTDGNNTPPQTTTPPKLEAAPITADTPPSAAADMPPPPALKLPSPQTTSPTDTPQASPLAPPPPVPPPIAPM